MSSSSQKQKAKAGEIVDTTHGLGQSEDISGSDSEPNDTADIADDIVSPSTSQKKKKKKKSKASKALAALQGKGQIPQEIVDSVLDQVKAEGTVGPSVNEENVRRALEHLKIMDVAKGKAGLGGFNKKDMGEHKVCSIRLPNLYLSSQVRCT